MKAILISIQSPHACNILNLIKFLEIRKKFPKDYVGWVYIYVTKALPHLAHSIDGDYEVYDETQWDKDWIDMNGKVVARFNATAEEITTRQDRFKEFTFYETSLDMEDLLKQSCLDYNELDNYLQGGNGTAIHINNLEIFDKPKEINEFKFYCEEDFCHCYYGKCKDCSHLVYEDENYCDKKLTRAPQSYCYIDV